MLRQDIQEIFNTEKDQHKWEVRIINLHNYDQTLKEMLVDSVADHHIPKKTLEK